MLPLCDKVVVAVGNSEDGTLELIKSIDPQKIEIVETVWNDNLRQGGQVLAVETNKAFDAISDDYDWCLYLQADEVLHERDYPIIHAAMQKWIGDKNTEGLLFKYFHFWGTYDYIGVSRQWYRHEIRIVRNDKQIRSYRDAQGFRKDNNKLKVRKIDAHIHHYGWVRPPEIIKAKAKNFSSLYHTGQSLEKRQKQADQFNYSEIDAVSRYKGTHPKVMETRLQELDWHVEIEESKIKFKFKEYLLFKFEKLFGKRLFEYKNYRIIN
jgi:hypothetical protein